MHAGFSRVFSCTPAVVGHRRRESTRHRSTLTHRAPITVLKAVIFSLAKHFNQPERMAHQPVDRRAAGRRGHLEGEEECRRQICQAGHGPRVPLPDAALFSSSMAGRRPLCLAVGRRPGSMLTLQGVLILGMLVRCTDGLRGCHHSVAVRGFEHHALAVALTVSLFHRADAATPLFSSFFPSESCCLKPNFLNENVAPELMRCKQVRLAVSWRVALVHSAFAKMRCPLIGGQQCNARWALPIAVYVGAPYWANSEAAPPSLRVMS